MELLSIYRSRSTYQARPPSTVTVNLMDPSPSVTFAEGLTDAVVISDLAKVYQKPPGLGEKQSSNIHKKSLKLKLGTINSNIKDCRNLMNKSCVMNYADDAFPLSKGAVSRPRSACASKPQCEDKIETTIDNDVTVACVSTLMNLSPSLTALDASFSHIKSLSMSLSPCVHLQSLNLSYNQLSTLSGIESCLLLIDLNVKNNKISDIHPLKALKLIKYIDISNNNISSIDSISVLSSLKELESLWLQGNPLTLVSTFTITDVVSPIPSKLCYYDGIPVTNFLSQSPPVDRPLLMKSLSPQPISAYENNNNNNNNKSSTSTITTTNNNNSNSNNYKYNKNTKNDFQNITVSLREQTPSSTSLPSTISQSSPSHTAPRPSSPLNVNYRITQRNRSAVLEGHRRFDVAMTNVSQKSISPLQQSSSIIHPSSTSSSNLERLSKPKHRVDASSTSIRHRNHHHQSTRHSKKPVLSTIDRLAIAQDVYLRLCSVAFSSVPTTTLPPSPTSTARASNIIDKKDTSKQQTVDYSQKSVSWEPSIPQAVHAINHPSQQPQSSTSSITSSASTATSSFNLLRSITETLTNVDFSLKTKYLSSDISDSKSNTSIPREKSPRKVDICKINSVYRLVTVDDCVDNG